MSEVLGRGARQRVGVRARATRWVLWVTLVALVELLTRTGKIPAYSLTAPSRIVVALWDLLAHGGIIHHVIATVASIALSLAISIPLGILIGLLLWRFQYAYRLLLPYFASYYGLPVFAVYPALVVIFGLSKIPVVLLAVLWSVVAVITSTVNGLMSIPENYVKTARIYELSPLTAMMQIYIKAAAPLIFGGITLASCYAVSGTIGGEFLLAPSEGIGYLVSFYFDQFQNANMYATDLVVVLIAMLIIGLISNVERQLFRRRQSRRGRDGA